MVLQTGWDKWILTARVLRLLYVNHTGDGQWTTRAMKVVALPFLEQVAEDRVPTASTSKAWRLKALYVINRQSELLALASFCCEEQGVLGCEYNSETYDFKI